MDESTTSSVNATDADLNEDNDNWSERETGTDGAEKVRRKSPSRLKLEEGKLPPFLPTRPIVVTPSRWVSLRTPYINNNSSSPNDKGSNHHNNRKMYRKSFAHFFEQDDDLYRRSHEREASSLQTTTRSTSRLDPLTAEGNQLISRTTDHRDHHNLHPIHNRRRPHRQTTQGSEERDNMIPISTLTSSSPLITLSSAEMTNMPLMHFDIIQSSPVTTNQVPSVTATSSISNLGEREHSYIPMITPTISSPMEFNHPHDDHHLTSDEVPFGNRLKSSIMSLRMMRSRNRRPSDRLSPQRLLVSSSPSGTTTATSSASKTPVLPTSRVQRVLKSVVETRVLAVVYNPAVTKYRTITHTKYFSSTVTQTVTSLINRRG